jgi:hypothetical protein
MIALEAAWITDGAVLHGLLAANCPACLLAQYCRVPAGMIILLQLQSPTSCLFDLLRAAAVLSGVLLVQ